MQYSSIVLAALAVVGAIATPLESRQNSDNVITVIPGNAEQSGSTDFTPGVRQVKRPFATNIILDRVDIRLGANVQPKTLRCQLLDNDGRPVVVQRQTNIDITFADGNNGTWNIINPTTISNIVCDPAFVANQGAAADPTATAPPAQTTTPASTSDHVVSVTLSGVKDTDVSTFCGSKREERTPSSRGPYNTVQVSVGAQVEDKLIRCQILNRNGKPIIVTRGRNTNTTFNDNNAGPWSFRNTQVTKVICDPAFR